MKTVVGIAIVLVVGGGLLFFGGNGAAPPIDRSHNPRNQDADRQDKQQEAENAVAELTRDAVLLGDPEAPLTLVELGDYQCTFCTRFFFQTKPVLEQKYIETGQLKMYFIDFAVNGRESVNAAHASQCAADQGAFWEYHNKLFEEREGYNAGVFEADNLVRFADEFGLDSGQFSRCYESDKYAKKVQQTTREAQLLGARGTPTFILNGHLIPGAQPLSVFENAINEMLGGVK